MDDEKPSTKHLVLKPKDVVPMDKLARSGDGSAISVQLIHKQNQLAEERAARRKRGEPTESMAAVEPQLHPVFKPKDITLLDPPSGPGDDEAIAVRDILLENKDAEIASGWGRVVHKKKRRISRRTRDFLIGVGAIDLALAVLMRFSSDPFTFTYGIAAITLVTSTTAWIMFFVIDDY